MACQLDKVFALAERVSTWTRLGMQADAEVVTTAHKRLAAHGLCRCIVRDRDLQDRPAVL